MGRPEAEERERFQRPTASSLAAAASASASGDGDGGSGLSSRMRGLGIGGGGTTRPAKTAAELLAPWRAQEEEEERRRRRRQLLVQGQERGGEDGGLGFGGDEGEAPAEFVGQIYPHTRHMVQWSPDGRWLASAQGGRVTIRDPGTMQLEALFSCSAEVEHMEWAPDSDGLLCASYKKGSVQVFRVSDPQWACALSEGSSGVSAALWAPDARHVLTVTDFGLALTVWPVLAGTDPAQTLVVRRPKPDVAPAFSPDGGVMAVASRLDARDQISLYATGTGRWRPLRAFAVDSVDCVALHWAPDGASLVVQDTGLVYGLHAFAPDGRKPLADYRAYEEGLGVKSVAFSPLPPTNTTNDGGTSQYLAVGSYDQTLRLLNPLTWEVAFDLGRHRAPAWGEEGAGGPLCIRDFIGYTEEAPGAGFIASLPPTLPQVKPDTSRANPKLGVGLLDWSGDGRFLLSRNDNMPYALFIWDVEERGLAAILLFATPVRSARWGPTTTTSASSPSHPHHNTSISYAAAVDDGEEEEAAPPQLCIATGGPRFYLWAPSVVPGTPPAAPAWFDIPVADGSFDVTRLRWAPLPPPSQQKGDWRNPLTPRKTGGRSRDVSMLRLRGAGAEEEEGQEEGAVMMVALMSADHWCVCALDQ